jgi:hypothetical protein
MQIRHDDLSSNLQENEHTLVEKNKMRIKKDANLTWWFIQSYVDG